MNPATSSERLLLGRSVQPFDLLRAVVGYLIVETTPAEFNVT